MIFYVLGAVGDDVGDDANLFHVDSHLVCAVQLQHTPRRISSHVVASHPSLLKTVVLEGMVYPLNYVESSN